MGMSSTPYFFQATSCTSEEYELAVVAWISVCRGSDVCLWGCLSECPVRYWDGWKLRDVRNFEVNQESRHPKLQSSCQSALMQLLRMSAQRPPDPWMLWKLYKNSKMPSAPNWQLATPPELRESPSRLLNSTSSGTTIGRVRKTAWLQGALAPKCVSENWV